MKETKVVEISPEIRKLLKEINKKDDIILKKG